MYDDFIAGWVAGGAGLLIGHPLDTVKTRLQTMNTYTGIWDCFSKTLRNETISGLYRGMLGPFMTIGMLHSLLFVGYGTALRIMHHEDNCIESRKDLPMGEILIASTVGTMMQLVPAIPIELVKTKLQVQKERISHFWESPRQIRTGQSPPQYKNPFDCARAMYRRGGLKALYKGGGVMFYRDMIGYMFYLPVYELLYRNLLRYDCNETFAQIVAGGTAGSAGWFSVCPLEVVKNRIQTTQNHPNTSVYTTVRHIYDTEGPRAFYKGGLTLIIRGFPVNAVLFVVYSKSMTVMQGVSSTRQLQNIDNVLMQ